MTTKVNSLGLERGLKIFLDDSIATESSPSLTFENDQDTGLYYTSTDTSINLSIGGTTNLKVEPNRIGILSSTNPPRASVDIGYVTDSIVLPTGNTTQRLSTTLGSLRYNSDFSKLEFRDSNEWKVLNRAYDYVDFSGATLTPVTEKYYLVDTTTAPTIATLPNTPEDGTIIGFGDKFNTFTTNSLTINASGTDTIGNISTTQFILDVDGDYIELVYISGHWTVTRFSRVTESQITNLGDSILLSSNTLGDLSPTTSSELAAVITDETGTGLLVFSDSSSLSNTTMGGTTTLTGLLTSNSDITTTGNISSTSITSSGATINGLTTINDDLSISGQLNVTTISSSSNINTLATLNASNVVSPIINTDKVVIGGTSPTISLMDGDHTNAFIHANNNLLYFMRGTDDNNTSGWEVVNGEHPLTINLDNLDSRFGGYLSIKGALSVESNADVSNNLTAGYLRSLSDVRVDNNLDLRNALYVKGYLYGLSPCYGLFGSVGEVYNGINISQVVYEGNGFYRVYLSRPYFNYVAICSGHEISPNDNIFGVQDFEATRFLITSNDRTNGYLGQPITLMSFAVISYE